MNDKTKKTKHKLRSVRWFQPDDLRSFGHQSRMMQMGLDKTDWGGRPNYCNHQYLVRSPALPMIYFPARPMLRGNYKGQQIGSGSDAWKHWEERRAGNISELDWQGLEGGIARSVGHCMTMGTASTMTVLAGAMGMTQPGAGSIPAADMNHVPMATACGRRIAGMVQENLTPGKIITRQAIDNACTIGVAIGCSTNAAIHLVAIARRAGIDMTIDDLSTYGREVPVLANIRPSGSTYLMEDFYYASGLLALMKQLRGKLDHSAITITGRPIGQAIERAEVYNEDAIRSLSNPAYPKGALAVLKGNLAPDGCVIKPSACATELLQNEGRALVFDTYADMKAAMDDEDLDVLPDDVLVLRNAGPQGGPGMPEWGMLPIPKKLLKQGVRDMLRLSDARMSETSYGACILHVLPESFVGGPLALLQTGDVIRVDVATRKIDMLVPDEEMARRRPRWQQPRPRYQRGYERIFQRHVTQSHQGCDFDFLETQSGIGYAGTGNQLTRNHPVSFSQKTREILMHVSCATLTTALYKRGFRNVFMQNVHRLMADGPNMVGPAFALRYIPAREDLNPLSVFDDRKHPQRVAIETCPERHALVMDSRGDACAASGSDILMTRLMKRGGAGVVTDGGLRDSHSIAELDMPAYHQRPSSPTNLILHQATDINQPIGCGGVSVFPGEIVVGDREGVVVIPTGIANDVAEEVARMTLFEDFVAEKVGEGQSILGLHPLTDPQTRIVFEEWKRPGNGRTHRFAEA